MSPYFARIIHIGKGRDDDNPRYSPPREKCRDIICGVVFCDTTRIMPKQETIAADPLHGEESAKILPCSEEALCEAAALLNAGGVAVIPTDTVYGLAAHPAFPAAVERLYTIKGRESGKKIALLASGADAVEAFGFPLTGNAAELAEKHWPGALTMILGDEGFRVPDHDWTRRLLEKCGGVLRVTSANLSGCRPATDAPQALADVGLEADLVIDDGISPGGVASTVVRINDNGTAEILRKGAIEI